MINWAAHRAQIERLYEDRATIITETMKKDPDTYETAEVWAEVGTYPCHLDWQGASVDPSATVTRQAQGVQVLLPPEAPVTPGCRIRVQLAAGRTVEFHECSPLAMKPSHQLVALELPKDVV